MNSNDQQQPDLTAYALGELDHVNDAAVQAWLVAHPEAQAEVDEVSELAQLLQSAAPVPAIKLKPAQRQAILSGPQRVREMVAAAARKASEPKRPSIFSIVTSVAKFSAAAAVVAGAFVAGEWVARENASPVLTNVEPPKSVPSSKPAAAQPTVATAPLKQTPVEPLPVVAVPEVKKEEVAAVVAAVKPAPVPVVHEKTLAVVVSKEPAKISPSVPPIAKTSLRVIAAASQSTAQSASASFDLHPSETRPPVGPAQPALAAQIRPAGTAVAAPEVGKDKTPPLLIHSWRAEVAACPWNESRRLVRISVQIPGEQPAALQGADYSLQVSFQPIHVKSFRALAQRSVAPTEKDGAAVHTAWYEIVPNGAPSELSRGIGQVMLSNSKFTTTAMSLFDSSKMQIMDKGNAWEAAADDFIFESAVVGLGLLMDGSPAAQGLNHSIVLHLAERAQKIADRTGERARFVKLVKDAQRAVGVNP